MSEREEIRVGIEREETDGRIAARLGRARSTINEEINHNGRRARYCATTANARAVQQRRRPKTPLLVGDPVLAAHVTARLVAKDSPMTISIELARGVHGVTASVSHETLYQAIYAHGTRGLRRGLHVGLHRRRRCRKHRLPPHTTPPTSSGPLGQFNLITTRPEIAATRCEVGHFEGDLITGAFNRSAIVTMFDRASRHVWLADLPEGHNAEATLAALVEILERIPQHLQRTLTWDQGREMARHHDLTRLCGIDIYFANPHAPWERPTNENGNGLLRRYLAKGTNLHTYTTTDLRNIEHRLNTMPRRSLHWNTAANHYHAAVAMTG
jgi:transposase, IS30 family